LPELVDKWSDREVLLRAQRAFPTRFAAMGIHGPPDDDQMKVLLRDNRLIKTMRRRLSDISWMMRMLKQRFAAQVNRQEEVTGHFWEGRFKMVAIVSEAQLLACMIYIALNQIRAGQATSLDTSFWTSICWQLQAQEMRQAGKLEAAAARDGFLMPLGVAEGGPQQPAAGTQGSRRASDTGALEMSLDDFHRLATWTAELSSRPQAEPPPSVVATLERAGLTPEMLQQAAEGIL
jgi:hypothetical protein